VPSPGALRRRTVLAVGAALSLPFDTARAQAFPSKPITLIVPWPPGGSTDRHHRLLAELAGKHLGQSIVVENKPGRGGTTGPVRWP
jgi:tripartite-type tricarboxylate transporter receptor subunit TctC